MMKTFFKLKYGNDWTLRKGSYVESFSCFVPIYKLDLKTGEVELLLSEAGVRNDGKYIFLPNDAAYENFNDNRWSYFWVFSKKYLKKDNHGFNSFRQSYLNEILNFGPTVINKLGYICFCFKEDLNNDSPLYFKEKLKKLSDEERNNPIYSTYLDLGGNEYIIEDNKEDEWIKANPIIRDYTTYYLNCAKANSDWFWYPMPGVSLKNYELLEDKMNNKFINKVKKLTRK